MWTRVELKDKAKGALRANYWKAVLVGLLLLFASGAGSTTIPSDVSSMALSDTVDTASTDTTTPYYSDPDYGYNYNYNYGYDYSDIYDGQDLSSESYGYLDDGNTYLAEYDQTEDASDPVALAFAIFGLLFIFMAVAALVIALDILILNPLEVGAKRFFLRDLNRKAEVKEVTYAFDNGNFVNTIKTMFLRDLFIVLWTMLFIIPGIVKAYEYRMIPYLLAEDPAMTKELAFAESKRMMDGQKWNAFVLDLSFWGWHILSVFTLGILSVFYVTPYQSLTNAALYEKLRYGQPAPAPQTYGPAAQPPVTPFAPPAGTAPTAPVAPVAPSVGHAPTAYGAAPAVPMASATEYYPASGAPASAAGCAPAASMAPQPPMGSRERADVEPNPTLPAEGASATSGTAHLEAPSEASVAEHAEASRASYAQPDGDAGAAEEEVADNVEPEVTQQAGEVASEGLASTAGDDEVAPR